MRTRNRKKLSADSIRQAPVLNRRYRLWDATVPNLFVSIAPTGVKSFNVQWSRDGCTAIGKFPGVPLETARTKALEILADAAKNGTPEVAKSKTAATTFKSFINDHYAPWAEAERKAGKATVAAIKAQFAEFDAKPLTAITAWSIEKFKARRLKAGIKASTVNRDLDRIRAALNKAVEWKLLTANPLIGVKRSKGGDSNRVRWLTVDEEKRLRQALADREQERRERRASGNAWAAARGRATRPQWADDEYTDHLAPLVLLAMNTGLRRGELLGLDWGCVDIERRQLKVAAATAKSSKDRHIPLNAEALGALQRLKKHSAGTGHVFRNADNEKLSHFRRSWASLMETAKLDDFHFHDCRHHFASRLAMAGVDLYAVKELLGHSDFAMTQRYAHLSEEHKAAAVAKLELAR